MNPEHNERLVHLWNHRGDGISAEGWADLYQLARWQLMSCNAPILSTLPDTRENYINDFFTDKVFETAGRNATPLYHAGALCSFFRNYLIERQRALGLEMAFLDQEEDNGVSFIDRLQAVTPEERLALDQDALQYGIPLTSARQSARELLTSLKPWQQVILARSTCADKDDKLTADELAKSMCIPSAHHHLRRLGVTKYQGGQGNPNFRDTLLGRWILGFGIEPVLDNVACIHWLLAVLCVEAMVMDQEEAQS